MYEKPFQLEIVAPDRLVYKGNAASLTAPGTEGLFQVLFNHAPLLALLGIGQLKVKLKDGEDEEYAVGGGFAEVRNNHVVVLVDSIERAQDIDIARAKAAKERAERRLHERDRDIDLLRAQLALTRALNRIRIAERAS